MGSWDSAKNPGVALSYILEQLLRFFVLQLNGARQTLKQLSIYWKARPYSNYLSFPFLYILRRSVCLKSLILEFNIPSPPSLSSPLPPLPTMCYVWFLYLLSLFCFIYVECRLHRSEEMLKDDELTLAVIRNVASLSSSTATGIVIIGGLVKLFSPFYSR